MLALSTLVAVCCAFVLDVDEDVDGVGAAAVVGLVLPPCELISTLNSRHNPTTTKKSLIFITAVLMRARWADVFRELGLANSTIRAVLEVSHLSIY